MSTSAASVVLKVLPDEGVVDAEELHSRRVFVTSLTRARADCIEQRVKLLWQQLREKQIVHVRRHMPMDPPHDFWVDHYYKVGFELTHSLSTQAGSTVPASHAARIASSSELRSGVNCGPCKSSPNVSGREVATGVDIGRQAVGMSNPAELRSGQERGHGIPELRSGAICGPCETSANLPGAEVATGVYIEQQEVGMRY